jgi:hypothetical protein
MDPFSLIGAMVGGVGSIIGAGESADAQEKNWQVNLLNYYLRERERKDRIQAAEQSRNDTMLGATDARGNRTHFVPGKGWVQELSSEDAALGDAQLREQMASVMEDAPRKRRSEQRNEERQLTEENTAGGLLNEFEQIQRENPESIRRLLSGYAAGGINEAFDDTAGDALKTATRMGSSNAGSIVSSIGRQRAKALSQAMQESAIKATEVADNNYLQRRQGVGSLYNQFAQRAAAGPSSQYAPQSTGGNTSQLMSQFAQLFSGDNRALEGAFGQKGGEMDYMQPDMGLANAFASIGGLMGGLGSVGKGSDDLEARRRLRKTSPGVY